MDSVLKKHGLFLVTAVTGALLGMGCQPEYPNCDNDEHCHEGEFCVDGQCQQCRNDDDCGPGEQCNDGRCDPIPGYCDESQPCPPGQECIGNRCEAIEGWCGSNADCPAGQECQNNQCVEAAPEVQECSLEPVYFGFDASSLTESARNQLQQNASCIRERDLSSVQITGHTDPRGTEEYNLALGDRRARSVMRYLQSLGVSSDSMSSTSMGEEMANGHNEETWSRDRRAEVSPR